jgi:hypothetical protein
VVERAYVEGCAVPTKIILIWHQENIRMTWYLKNPRVNVSLDLDWKMPEHEYKINMGTD